VNKLWRKLCCHFSGHQWIAQTRFTPAPRFQDVKSQLKFDLLAMGAVLLGLPELGILIIGVTDVERFCSRCGRYEKGSLFGEASAHEASTKPLRMTSPV